MKAKLLFGAGIAAGYVLGSRSGRAAYDRLKAKATSIWGSKPVQDKVAAVTEAVKERAPEVTDQLAEAARRSGTMISSALHHDGPGAGSLNGNTSHGGQESDGGAFASGPVPAHSTHPETVNLGTSGLEPDVDSDPALNDQPGQDWTDEGGATPAGAATNLDPDKKG